MFICDNCKNEFNQPYIYYETHGLPEPPFERFYLCPQCKSENYRFKEERKKRYATR